jgi:colanic acid biosynthesis glycosyl transferase WcaI
MHFYKTHSKFSSRLEYTLMNAARNIWFISEVYHPDEQGTAFYTTGLAEGLAENFNVRVLCNYPTVTARGVKVPQKESRNGVSIERCGGTTFDKDIVFLRLLNIITYSAALFFKALIRINKGDIVIAVTSPPSAPFIAKLVCSFTSAKCILRIEDVYPEIFVATGFIKKDGLLNSFLEYLTSSLYTRVDRIVVLGRDMKALAEKKTGHFNNHLQIIRCWADTDVVFPMPKESNPLLRELGLESKFIVSCVGNMGRAQAIELMFEAITLLRHDDRIHFLFIGSGAKRGWMEREVDKRGLANITLLDQRPRVDQINFLNACDISIISLLPGMTGAGVPSRMYNTMAAGKPIIALTSEQSEVSLIVQEEDIGWVVSPDNAEKLAQAILDAQSDPARLTMMGDRAHAAAIEKYAREIIIREYFDLVTAL